MNTTFTHKGWFGLCPVYYAGLATESPVVDPRWWIVGWLMPLSEAIWGLCFFVREMFGS